MLLNIPSKVLVGKASIIELTIDDQSLVSQNLEQIKLGVYLEGGDGEPIEYIELLQKEKSDNKDAII